MDGAQRETKPQTTAKEQSIIGRKITSGLFYLKSRNRNHTEGLTAMCIGVWMSSSAWIALSSSHGIRTSGSPSGSQFSCPVLPSPVQSCPASPVHCGLAPALNSLSCHQPYSALATVLPYSSTGYLGICLCLSFLCLWRPWSLCSFLWCLRLKSLQSRYEIYLCTYTQLFDGD